MTSPVSSNNICFYRLLEKIYDKVDNPRKRHRCDFDLKCLKHFLEKKNRGRAVFHFMALLLERFGK